MRKTEEKKALESIYKHNVKLVKHNIKLIKDKQILRKLLILYVITSTIIIGYMTFKNYNLNKKMIENMNELDILIHEIKDDTKQQTTILESWDVQLEE
jgi:Zn-dependent oligopeptidase